MGVKRRLAARLDQAQTQLNADKLTAPPGDNAEESYREVLALDPGNEQALAGRQHLIVRFAELAQERRFAGEFKASLNFIEQGLELAPEDATLLALKDDVVQRMEARQPRAVGDPIAALLAKAEQQMASLKLTRPVGDNAYETLQAMLVRDPNNGAAMAALAALAERYAAFARRRLQAGAAREALEMVERGLAIDPQHRDLLALKKELTQPENAPQTPATELASLLAKAEQQLTTGRSTKPPGDNAFETLQKLLRLDPNHRPAQQQLASIPKRCEQRARATRQAGNNTEQARFTVAECLRFFPRDAALIALRDELNRPAAEQKSTDIGAFEESPPAGPPEKSEEPTARRRPVVGRTF